MPQLISKTASVLHILTDKSSPRLEYVCEVIFKLILKLDYQILPVANEQDMEDQAVIKYSDTPSPGLCIRGESFITESSIRRSLPGIRDEGLLKLSFSEETFYGFTFDFDLFSSAFYLLTEYESYQLNSFDEHGRHDERASMLYSAGYHILPVVNLYAEVIWNKLKEHYPTLERQQQSFNYCITVDIDSPWLYMHKPMHVQVGGLIKDLLKTDLKAVSKRLSSAFQGQDSYDVYDYILESIPADKLLFFFLLDRNSGLDERYTYRNIYYRELIRKVVKRGTEIGIHPSYTSYLDKDRICFEKEKLQEICSKKINRSRMHFLKYRLPDTYRHLIACGITNDYTSCLIHNPGFRHFIAIPFPWFDLEKNSKTDLMIHPSMIMDRTLQKYLNQGPEEALRSIKSMIDVSFDVNGTFSIILHNSTLSEWKEWEGWRNVFEKTVAYLQEKTVSV